MKILIIDDNIVWIELLGSWLNILDIEYDSAENGYEGIELLQNNNYDLLITDISMPKMSGFKLVDYVKQYYNVTIAVMSNHDEYIKLMTNVENKFLKPNTFEEFKKIINIIIENSNILKIV